MARRRRLLRATAFVALMISLGAGFLFTQQAAPPVKPRHHVQVEDDSEASPDLSRATELIQKKDYAAAEPLLQKITAADTSNYVAWFDLGFVEKYSRQARWLDCGVSQVGRSQADRV